MGKYQKQAKRRQKKRQQESIVVLILTGIVVLCLLAITNFMIFLWCVGVLVLLGVAYFTISISKHATQGAREQSGIVRDRRYISPALRQAVWTRCGGRCVQCQSQSMLEYDHIIPLSRGGATSYENLQVLCRSCNRHKSDRI